MKPDQLLHDYVNPLLRDTTLQFQVLTDYIQEYPNLGTPEQMTRVELMFETLRDTGQRLQRLASAISLEVKNK